ncbi:hypothetical protein [Paraburkholderia caballeronis]|uniref:hypothetical protein n=1 Tax=Paraburkholderia caballeronis TaxID=416943 RepID=UPI001FBB9AAB|nr:hypothetical protein [Paraburkholderia caballeronis]
MTTTAAAAAASTDKERAENRHACAIDEIQCAIATIPTIASAGGTSTASPTATDEHGVVDSQLGTINRQYASGSRCTRSSVAAAAAAAANTDVTIGLRNG